MNNLTVSTIYASDYAALQQAIKASIDWSAGYNTDVTLYVDGNGYDTAWGLLAEWCDCRGDESGDWEFAGVDAFHQFAQIKLVEVAK